MFFSLPFLRYICIIKGGVIFLHCFDLMAVGTQYPALLGLFV